MIVHEFLPKVVRFLRDETGPTTVEYAMLFLLIFLAVLTAITTLGEATSESFAASSNSIEQAVSSRP